MNLVFRKALERYMFHDRNKVEEVSNAQEYSRSPQPQLQH